MLMQKIVFLTTGNPGYSRSWVYYVGLKQQNKNVDFFLIDENKLIKSFKTIKNQTTGDCIFVVMSPSHYLVPLVRLFLGKKIILDAGWSLFEGTIVARKKIGFLFYNLIKVYLIDLFASTIARVVLLESKTQRDYYSNLLLTNKDKCLVLYTGLDETTFYPNESLAVPADLFKNGKIVLFRGKANDEAGLKTLAEATLLLKNEPITFCIFSPGIKNNLVFSENTVIEQNYIKSKGDLAKIFQASFLILGQMSSHIRLERTIPHKAFEAAFSGKPYLTSRAGGILEIFEEDKEVICFAGGDPKDLAEKIKLLINHPTLSLDLSLNIKAKYNQLCSQKVLTELFIEIVKQRF
jgi:glycosyltransferase involved in cell wall biosynthesis